MKHLAHLVRTDARRFGILLAVWVLLEIADTVFRAARPALATDVRLATSFDLLGTVLFMTRWLGMIVIVALVVQTHTLVGSDAFWMTRPIRWRDLLASKLVLLGTVFVAIPTLCEIVLMLALRIPASDVPRIALQTVLFRCLWLSLFMALAAMTRNLARLALVGGSLLVGLALLLNISIVLMLRDLPEGPQMTDVTPRALPNPAGAVATLVLLIGVAVAFILVQYRTRLVRAALATGAAGLAGAILFLWVWPWQFQLAPVPPWATSDAAVRLASASTEARFRPLDEHNPWSSTEAWRIGSVQLVAGAIEDGWLATARLDTAVMSFGDGTTLSTAGNGYASPVHSLSFEGAPDDGAIQRVLGVRRLLETAPEHLAGTWAPAMILRQADFEKYQGVPGTYRGQFMVDIDRVVVAATLPLQAGAGFQGHHYRLRIDQVGVQGSTAVVRVRQFTSGSMFDEEETPRLTFFLRNRAAAEAVPGSALGDMGLSGGVGLMAFGFSGFSAEPQSGFHVTSNVTRFPAGYGVAGRRVELSAEWLSEAELVIVQTISAGSITRTLEVFGLRMVVAPPTRMPQ